MSQNTLLGSVALDAIDAHSEEDIIDVALNTVRKHLEMEVAYLSEFVDGQAVFRAVSAPGLENMIKPGDSKNLQDIYCQHILDGRLPNVIPDTQAEPIAMALPITSETPIRSHVSVPVRRIDGSVYGMFCCLSPSPNPTLNDRDLRVMETFADLASKQIHSTLQSRSSKEKTTKEIGQAIDTKGFNVVYQPIMPFAIGVPCGFEALCRFAPQPYRAPNEWFDDAAKVGLDTELEIAVIEQALLALNELPQNVYLSVNASPKTITSGRLVEVFAGYPAEQIVVELTEHVAVDDFEGLQMALCTLAYKGCRIAIDDVGAGHSGLSQILRVRPNLIKLDMELTRDIGDDIARQSLVMGMVHFAESCDAMLIAEGIENQRDYDTLKRLNVHLGQGYFLGKPEPLDAALRWYNPPEASRA